MLVLASSALALAGCKSLDELFCSEGGCEWSAEEWSRLQTLSPLPDPPPDTSNRYADNDKAIELGQEFYFDPRFSGNVTLVDSLGRDVPPTRAESGKSTNVSCSTCHDPKRAGADFTSSHAAVSIGAGWYDVNGQQTVNAAYYPLLYWNGRTDSLWSQAAAVSESGVSMNGTRLQTFWVIVNNYRDAYSTVFADSEYQLPAAPTTADFPATGKPTAADGKFDIVPAEANRMLVTGVFVNWAKAIGAFERTLISRDSLFDQFVSQGPSSTKVSPAAKRGARLFVGKASCIDCHNGPMLSDGSFHDIGVPQVGDHVPTVADCVKAPCDCTRENEQANCLPSGAWGGLLKLARSKDGDTINYNNLRRDSTWSDDRTVTTLAPFYEEPTDTSLKGAWRTPSLRDVALTPPYMHDGVFTTLEQVVWHYNTGGAASGSGQFVKSPARAVQLKPLGLTDSEQADLVEFLKTLTGAPLDARKTVRPPSADAGAPPDAGSPPDAGAPAAASQ